MIGITGLKSLVAAPGDIDILFHGAAHILLHDHTCIGLIFFQVRIFHLGITDHDFGTRFQTAESDLRDAGHILAHVIDKDSGTDLTDTAGGKGLVQTDRLAELCRKGIMGIIISTRPGKEPLG